MSKTFTVNGVTYTAVDFTFNTICELEDMGVSLQDFASKPMSMVRSYLAISAKKDLDFAGEQIEQHIVAGGTFEDVIKIIAEKMDESGFFQALNKTTEADNSASKSKKTAAE